MFIKVISNTVELIRVGNKVRIFRTAAAAGKFRHKYGAQRTIGIDSVACFGFRIQLFIRNSKYPVTDFYILCCYYYPVDRDIG